MSSVPSKKPCRVRLKPAIWRYSLRWSLRHRPCPGPEVLAEEDVAQGASCPASVLSHWVAGSGYAVCLDFVPVGDETPRKWSDERKGATRRRNMERHVIKAAPLFADELIGRELAARPDYFAGKSRR